MTTGTKRGQFLRSSGALSCLSPTYIFLIFTVLFGLMGYHSWSQSQRTNNYRLELGRVKMLLHEAIQRRLQIEGKVIELRRVLDVQLKPISLMKAESSTKRFKTGDSQEDKEKRITTLESELVQVRERLERCNSMGMRVQSKLDETETNVRSSTVARNKTMCDLEIAHQYDEIDKWIKSMVDDRTYSQFQLKFSKDGEKSEMDKLQKLEKVVMQRDEIKAQKDERIKEEIRAREQKNTDPVPKKTVRTQPSTSKSNRQVSKAALQSKLATRRDVEERNL